MSESAPPPPYPPDVAALVSIGLSPAAARGIVRDLQEHGWRLSSDAPQPDDNAQEQPR